MSKAFDALTPGLSGVAEMCVTEADTAASMGSGRMAVLATPAMVALMEAAAQAVIAPYLPEDHHSVGTFVSVRHDGATPIGMKVMATALLTSVEGRNLRFQVSASDENGEIGRGEHERSISSASVFLRLLRQKAKPKNA